VIEPRPRQDLIPTAEAVPDEGQVVDAMDSGGHVQPLVRKGALWFFPDWSMYVYFTPRFWRPIEGAAKCP
jgi:hypothetical protein